MPDSIPRELPESGNRDNVASHLSEDYIIRTLCACLILMGCVSTAGGPPQPASSRPPIALSSLERGAVGAALASIIEDLPPDSVAACVTIRGGPPAYWYSPDSLLLHALSNGARRVKNPAGCPPTYGQMVRLVDSTGRSLSPAPPKGYVDPYEIVVNEYRFTSGDNATVVVRLSQGTRNVFYECVSRRAQADTWRAECRKTGESLSALPPERAAAAD